MRNMEEEAEYMYPYECNEPVHVHLELCKYK